MDDPVAWMWSVYSGAGYTSRGIDFYPTDIPFAKHTPLYTAPPKRKWVGLTEQEQSDIAWEKDKSRIWIVTATEAKLKEKNT